MFRFIGQAAMLCGATLLVTSSIRAQGVRVIVDEITTARTTDSSQFGRGSSDELYFVIAGASTHHGAISIPRVHPFNADTWSVSPATGPVNGIVLYEGFMSPGQQGVLAVAIRDQDGNPLAPVLEAARILSLAVGAIFQDPSLAAPAAFIDAAKSFAGSLSQDSDDTMGVFLLNLSNVVNGLSGTLSMTATPIADTTVVSSSPMIQLFANGRNSSYSIRLRVEQFDGLYMVNRRSQLCVDVPPGNNLMSNGVQVIQYPCGGFKQRWLPIRGSGSSPNAGPISWVNQVTGKCLQVRGASSADGAAIEQWGCDWRSNQQLGILPVPLFPFGAQNTLVNAHSGKCMQIPAIGSDIEQRACNFSTAQVGTFADSHGN